jgi:hypothetical protein
MAQPQQPESPLLEQFKEQLRKLAEEAGPIKCPSRETFTAMGQLFVARYLCGELADIRIGSLTAAENASLALKIALKSLYAKANANAFRMIPTGLLYMLYAYKQPDIVISITVPHHHSLATQFFLSLPLFFALEDYAKGFLESIVGHDVYMLSIGAETEGKIGVFFAFGLMSSLRENEFYPLVTKDNVTTNYTGLTINGFDEVTFSISPIHLEGEIFNAGILTSLAIQNSKLRLWVLKDPSLGKIFVQTV